MAGQDAATIGEICRRLDGMPLAIELAARRTASMPLKTILAGLDDQLALLAGGNRTGPARHVDLTAAIDWSHRLLHEPEKALLRRVSILRGGFDTDAATAVAADGPYGLLPARRILPLLLELEAKSLIVRTTTTNPPHAPTSAPARQSEGTTTGTAPRKLRFRQLEAVRTYAQQRLEASGEAEKTRQRVLAWLTELVEPLTESVYPDLTVDTALAERDNLAAAIATAPGLHGTPGGPPPVLVFALAEVRCHQEQVSAARALLEAGPDWPDRRLQAARLALAATLSLMQGDTELGLQFSEQAVTLARALQDPVQLAKGLEARATARLTKCEYPQAVEDKLACAAILATLSRPLETAVAHHNVAWALLQAGRPAEADAFLADCLPVLREQAPPPVLGCVLHTAGAVRLACKDWPAARGLFAEALRAMPAEGYPGHLLIEGLAAAAAAQGEHRRAVRLFTAAAHIQTQQEIEPEPCWQDQISPFRSTAAAALPSTTHSDAQASARTLSWTHLVAYALDDTEPRAAQNSRTGPLGPLTARERTIAELVAQGLTNQQIATTLKSSPHTIATHLNRIRNKLNLRTRTQITHWLAQHTPPTADTRKSPLAA